MLGVAWLVLWCAGSPVRATECWTNLAGRAVHGRLVAGDAHAVTLALPRHRDAAPTDVVRDDLVNPPALIDRLRQGTRPVDLWLRGELAAALPFPDAADAAGREADAWIEARLVPGLNLLVNGERLYDRGRFAGLTLRRETEALLRERLRGARLAYLNRLLLEDAYPRELARVRTLILPLRSLAAGSQRRAAWRLGLSWPLEPAPPGPWDQTWGRAVKLRERGDLEDGELEWIGSCLTSGAGTPARPDERSDPRPPSAP